jgi:hypothetical protein
MSQGPRWFVVLAAVVLTSASQAEGPEKGPRESDAVLYSALRGVINRGVDLYNAGDSTACYRLFEGSLMTIRPQLEHHPALQKVIAQSLAAAERDPVAWRRAFTLRNALDKVRTELNPRKKTVVEKGTAPKTDDIKAPSKGKEDDKGGEKLPLPRIEEEKQGGDNDLAGRFSVLRPVAGAREGMGNGRLPAGYSSFTGKIVRAGPAFGNFWNQTVYRLDSVADGMPRPLTYAISGPGVNLEAYLGRVVEVVGPGHYDGELRNNVLKATRVVPKE